MISGDQRAVEDKTTTEIWARSKKPNAKQDEVVQIENSSYE